MNEIQQDRKFRGQYTISKVSLITHQGVEADLLHVFTEINIYEDIFSTSLSGNISIYDSINLISNLPIVGGETLELEWSTSAKEDTPIKKTMVVHRIGDKIPQKERVRSYTLYFVTPEAFMNQQVQLIKSYTGTPSKIIEDIFYKDAFPDTTKPIVVEKTKNIHSLVSCHWNPFKAFTYLAKRAVSIEGKTAYLFYESLYGFNFRSLETLFEQEPSVKYQRILAVNANNFSSDEFKERFSHVESFLIGESGQVLDMVNRGAFGHTWVYVDVFNKRIDKKPYVYDSDFNKTKHVEQYPFYPDNVQWLGDEKSNRYMSVIHPGSTIANNTMAGQLQYGKRLAILNQLSMVEETIEVAGDSEMFVGNVAEFDPPSPESMDTQFKRERYYSGKSLVTAIRHQLTKTGYKMFLTLAKDSLSDDPAIGGKDAT